MHSHHQHGHHSHQASMSSQPPAMLQYMPRHVTGLSIMGSGLELDDVNELHRLSSETLRLRGSYDDEDYSYDPAIADSAVASYSDLYGVASQAHAATHDTQRTQPVVHQRVNSAHHSAAVQHHHHQRHSADNTMYNNRSHYNNNNYAHLTYNNNSNHLPHRNTHSHTHHHHTTQHHHRDHHHNSGHHRRHGSNAAAHYPQAAALTSQHQPRYQSNTLVTPNNNPTAAAAVQNTTVQLPPFTSLIALNSASVALLSDPTANLPQSIRDISLPPAEHKLEDEQILKEKPEHALYIYGFRVEVCEKFLKNECTQDAYSCFSAHSRTPRRRKPQLIHNRFNYIPTRCRYVSEEQQCPQSIHCRFAHVTEEVIYHPSKYKTQLCTHQADANGCCTGYGTHCAKAHSESDRRDPVYEQAENEQALVQSQYQLQSTKHTFQDFYTFVSTPSDRDVERLFYMYVYKTARCPGFPYNCQCNGLDYHRDEERRRGPIIRYAPIACPNVKQFLNSEYGDPNVDCSGKYKKRTINPLTGQLSPPQKSSQWDCDYAHTLLELMYHPQVFKTGLCDHFDESHPATWRCVWGRRCAHAHGKDDLRTKEDATEEWKQHLKEAGLSGTVQLLQQQTNNLSNALHPVTLADGTTGSNMPLLQPPYSPNRSVATTRQQHAASDVSDLASTHAYNSGMNGTLLVGANSKPRSFTMSDVHSASQSGSVSPSHRTRNGSTTSPSHTPSTRSSRHSPAHSATPLLPGHPTSPSYAQQANSLASPSMTAHGIDRVVATSSPITSARSPLIDIKRISIFGDSNNATSNKESSDWPEVYNQQRSASRMSRHSSTSTTESQPPPRSNASSVSSNDQQLTYDQSQLLSVNRDGSATFKVAENADFMTVSKVIQIQRYDQTTRLINDSNTLLQLTQHSQLPNFVPYIRVKHTPTELHILQKLTTTDRPLTQALAVATMTEQGITHTTIQYVQQLFETLHTLHSHDLVHGGIAPHNISLNNTFESVTVNDIDRQNYVNTIDTKEQQSADVYYAATVAYYILTAGKTPFKTNTSSVQIDRWTEYEVASPLDTSILSPTAAHLILHILFTPSDRRMTSTVALRHPLFWPATKSIHFLQRVVAFIRTDDASLQPEITEFCQALDSLGSSIIGSATNHSVDSHEAPTWATSIHQIFLQSQVTAARLDGGSVVSLIHLIADLVDYISDGKQIISCHLHTLLHLQHLQNCNRPTRAHSQQSVEQQMNGLSLNASSDDEAVLRAVSDYFLPRFSSLLVSVFHLVTERWKDQPVFEEYFGSHPSSAARAGDSTSLHSSPSSRAVSRQSSPSQRATTLRQLPQEHNTRSVPATTRQLFASPGHTQRMQSPAPASSFGNKSQSHTHSQHPSRHPSITMPMSTNSGDSAIHSQPNTNTSLSAMSLLPALQCCVCQHTLHTPVTLPCCSRNLCRSCIPAYLMSTEKADTTSSHATATCICGHSFNQQERQSLPNLKTNQQLSAVLQLLPTMQQS